MVSLAENIRRIGIFMIAAQTVMHFAAGKQYEKYMKVITSVILLLMFVGPFTSSSVSQASDWQEDIKRMEQRMQSNIQQEIPYAVSPVETVALRQIQEEVKAMLNDTVSGRDCSVVDVMIELEELDTPDTSDGMSSRNWEFQRVRITLQSMDTTNASDGNADRTIRVEEITVGIGTEADNTQRETQDSERNAQIQEYRRLFAQTLGITVDKVEVTYRGGW